VKDDGLTYIVTVGKGSGVLGSYNSAVAHELWETVNDDIEKDVYGYSD